MIQDARPMFLGIGANKAGTSWVHSQLSKHPQIWVTPVKEVHFFDRSPIYPSPNYCSRSSPLSRILNADTWERERIKKSLKIIFKSVFNGKIDESIWWTHWSFGYYNEAWYQKLFPTNTAHFTYGEITPSYSILEEQDISNIKRINAGMKLLFFIRNPIDRAWSSIRHSVDIGKLNINLDAHEQIIEALKQPRVVMRGDYERTLENYLKYFDSSQILICFYEAIQEDPIGLMSGITQFLGVDYFEEKAVDNKSRVNVSSSYLMPAVVKDYLCKQYSPMINRLSQTLGSYAKVWEQSLFASEIELDTVRDKSQFLPTLHP
mgnify:CR=1 FL=1